MTTPVQVRTELVKALELDLVGPAPDDSAHREEILTQAPSKWYLTGFLAPRGSSDDSAEEGLEEMSSGGEDNSLPEATAAKKALFPSSMGLTVFIPADAENVEITVHWADYYPIELPETPESAEEEDPKPLEGWQRKPREITLAVPPKNDTIELSESQGLKLVIKQRSLRFPYLPTGTRSLSVFLVNSRPAAKSNNDTAFVFQARLTLHHKEGFVPRVNSKGLKGKDLDEAIAALQYRHDYEFVVGHNVSTRADVADNICRTVHTDWLPVSEVPRVAPAPIRGVELGMETLAAMGDVGKLQNSLAPLVTEYGDWITHHRATPIEPSESVFIAKNLLDRAEVARTRIAEGIDLLEDPDVFYAFRLANRAISVARKRQICQEKNCPIENIAEPKWRPFQLAFILLNLAGIADPEHDDRQTVDLLFFPTGGGKTEAYLGLAAFTLILRRLKNPGITSAGVSVLMRYTLRLLTLDQLERASRTICALELERQRDTDRLGPWPFEIGLWVGQNATPNKMGKQGDKDEHSAYSRTFAFQKDPKSKAGPIPLERCPWCGEIFKPTSFQLFPKELKIFCANRRCDFQGDRSLPIVAVDESIYHRLPCFIIATVDKFASLPWVGQTAALFGRVSHFKEGEGFSSAADGGGSGRRLDRYLPPPDLIVQDELHLISGPLGTMVGLYETAIGALCGTPKIIASTATVRRAGQQIRALFNRSQVDVFPPPGPDRHDSFFARTLPIEESPGRLYVGVGATGRSLKVILLRVYLALLAASEKRWELAGGKKNPDNPADPYMTLLGYFNSLRELGGSRRIVEDEVNNRLNKYGERNRYGETDSYFANRKIDDEPEELTSRVSTNKIANTKRRLSLPYSEKERVDIALATNMISVGLDIVRLGLMVVLGQPKTAAEYIQATSRVGREINKPGLVVTLFNLHRPRDRSHYERFVDWHTNFYRAVEATSVTPFSERALDRGLAGVTVALSRLLIPEMTEPIGASRIVERRADLDRVVEIVTRRAIEHINLAPDKAERLREKVRGDVLDLLDTWQKIAERETRLQYQSEIDTAVALLLDAADPNAEREPFDRQKFKAGRSLRDVEHTVKLRVRDPDGHDMEESR
jgi:hypothetical protein